MTTRGALLPLSLWRCTTKRRMGGLQSANNKDLSKETVVIVGGGYAGAKVAKDLDSKFNVVLIDRTNYFFHNVGSPRAFVDPTFAPALTIPYDKLLKRGQVIEAQVLKATATELTLKGRDEPLKGFDYLVIATGTSYAFPYKVPENNAKDVPKLYEAVADQIAKAENVVIVGAGSTGLEAATEIAEAYPKCHVTLVFSSPRVMPGPQWKDKFVAKFETQLAKLFPNIELVSDDRVDPTAESAAKFEAPESGSVTTKKGRELKADLVFWCIGGRVNSSAYEETFATEKNFLKVDDTLLVQGTKNVFACGDCAATTAAKTVMKAEEQAKIVVENIKKLAAGKALVPYKAGPDLNVTQLGHVGGAGQLPLFGGMVIGPKAVQTMKKDLFVGKFWKDLGYVTGGPKLVKSKIVLKNKTIFDDDGLDDVDDDNKKAKLQSFLKDLSPDYAAALAKGLLTTNGATTDGDHT
mmetsp:Transcript_10638/g.35202  ORF Transcript_10638/g.35202 Transcript_10638/m.35202 type:complete len:465 (+) Transcript_10638:2-1396(+)